ncbi:hypothetical protein EPYR_03877 [Erwinia pyrifoliae DSM 12163]|nr:hypothetical protein CPI84_00335 [Erwinia pyrifoliae]MCA8875177.1 hypothetical protein [Erwinia pyrifoliae]CAX57385.1 uncharacterized protein EpC_36050 [Erwinia pyrifoliae Ep1/96]CAY76257.1 hypothetical protein EPYR_03877 [Erwinia pyrifoliae DSM 12163]
MTPIILNKTVALISHVIPWRYNILIDVIRMLKNIYLFFPHLISLFFISPSAVFPDLLINLP